jgi:hypothetical protein
MLVWGVIPRFDELLRACAAALTDNLRECSQGGG